MEKLIHKNEYYSILSIHKLHLFSFAPSYEVLKRLILRDIKNGNKIFKVVIYGKGNGKRYKIKGSTLLKILKDVRQGFIFNNY